MRQRADENSDMEAHVNRMNELFQQLLALGDELKPEFILSATLLGSLPSSYDGLITALEARSETELSSSFVRSKIIEEYRRRKDRDNGGQGESHVLKFSNTGATKKSTTCYFCKRNGHYRNECDEYAKWKAEKGIPGNQNKSKANIVKSDDASDEFLFLVGRVNGWILDSGATCHVSCKRENFIEFDGTHSEKVSVANGQEVRASGRGKVAVVLVNGNSTTAKVTIEDVLYVPSIGGNLISVKRLTEKGFKVEFSGNTCEIRTKDNNRQIAVSDIVGNLYQMRVANEVNTVTNYQKICVHQWHRVLGHRDIYVKEIPSSNLVTGMALAGCSSGCIHSKTCETCIQGKITRAPFPNESQNRSSAVLDLIHSDVCGPMQTKTASGYRYMLTFIDDFSRYTKIYLLKEKSEVFQKFKEFHQLVQNQFDKKIKSLRTDRGGEYLGNAFVDYLNKNGIKSQRTAPHSPQQNGVAERKNRTLIEMARCMLFDANMEFSFWGEAVMMANFLQNRLPWKNVDKTPFEHWYGRKPIYTNLRRSAQNATLKFLMKIEEN